MIFCFYKTALSLASENKRVSNSKLSDWRKKKPEIISKCMQTAKAAMAKKSKWGKNKKDAHMEDMLCVALKKTQTKDCPCVLKPDLNSVRM